MTGVWALDTETSGLHPDDGARVVLLAAAVRRSPKVIETFAWPTPYATNSEWPECDRSGWERTCTFFAQPGLRLVWHNAKFDLLHSVYTLRGLLQSRNSSLRSLATGWIENTFWDTMLAHKVIQGEHSAGLKPIARRLWQDAKTEGEGYFYRHWGKGPDPATEADEIEQWFIDHRQKTRPRYSELPWDLISRYARKDVELTLKLMEWQQDFLEEHGDAQLRRLVQREIAFSKVVLGMELRGIRFDVEEAHISGHMIKQEMQSIEATLPFRTTLPAAKDFFFGRGALEVTDQLGRTKKTRKLGLEPVDRTPTGAAKLDQREMDQLAKEGHPYAREFHRHQGLKSMIAKWYDPWPLMVGEDGRLRPVFNLTKVRSTRLSVERAQLQAIPHIRHFRDLDLPEGVALPRELFQAKTGHELWEVDLSQGEVRIAAAVTGCQEMRKIVETPGADVHGETTKLVFGIDESHPEWKSRRDVAKRLTFGTIYGAGPVTLRETIRIETGIDVPLDSMKTMISRYKNVFPEFFYYMRQAERFCEANRHVVLVSGKKRWFNFGEPLWEKAHTAFNAVIQGGLAEAMRDAMLEVDRRWPGALLLQIHDSLVLELPRGTASIKANQVRRVMTNTYETAFGIKFEAEAARWEDKS